MISTELADQIEAAANDLGKGFVYLLSDTEPANDSPKVLLLAQGFQRALTAIAMMGT